MSNFTYFFKATCVIVIILLCYPLNAQHSKTSSYSSPVMLEAEKRIDDYLKLLRLGYSEKEIFEDLGNVNFLTENYETAAFWYQKLIDISAEDEISQNYLERYQYAMQKSGIATSMNIPIERDWLAMIKEDYQMKRQSKQTREASTLTATYRELDFRSYQNERALEALYKLTGKEKGKAVHENGKASTNLYEPPIAVTHDGNTAYFSKPEYVKPKYGLFSKKQLVHKIYKADKVNGEWKHIKEVAVCPKYYSAMHPTVSEDGKRLFFASNMPGTYGEYDIYVADIGNDGHIGKAKNLGKNVNTKKNDLYPNLVNGTLLFFASEGHDGFGGMDLYATQVAFKEVGLAVNLGSPINSNDDDFAIALQSEKGLGYVISNRGKAKDAYRQLVFSYYDTNKKSLHDIEEYKFLEVMNTNLAAKYSNTIFED